MPQIHTSLEIPAEPAAIWSVLTDWPAYGEWCHLIPKIRGEARVGGKVDFKLRLIGPTVPIDAFITRYEPGRVLEWEGPRNSALGILAKGRHFFEIEDMGDGRSRFVHGEVFSGPGFSLPWRHLRPRLELAYTVFNETLARRVEVVQQA